MASEEDNKHDDVLAIELPAPSGWTKKFTPKKTGTLQKNEIIFISPTGEEIKSKRQLDQYLKSHPGGPASSEFDWGTGDTPRRSARLSEKSKAVVPSPSESPKKKQRKSSTKGAKEKINADEDEDKATDGKDANAEETKEPVENSTKDAKGTMDGEANTEDNEKKTDTEDNEKKTDPEASLEGPSGVCPVDAVTENINASVKESNDATNVVGDAGIDEPKEAKIEESKEASIEVLSAENDVPKDAPHAGVGTADREVENNAEETREADKPGEKDSLLQGATGS